jgi:2-phosphosulfolactate phosphatase
MKITVALTPRLLRDARTHAVAVVDVLRATTSLVAMFERGLSRAIVADSLRDARRLALQNAALLCGEVKAVPPAGFDYGNSPAEFAELSLEGKSAVLWTTNGTRALGAASAAPAIAVAALTNRRAAARRLIEEAARHQCDMAVVCAGLERGAAFSLEDTVCAGAIVEVVRELDAGVALADSAWAALHLWKWYDGDATRAFGHSTHGRALRALGFERDLEHAARVDTSDVVPMLAPEDGIKVVRLCSAWGRGAATI